MSTMNQLDYILHERSLDAKDYENKKCMMDRYLDGEMEFDDLPPDVQDAVEEWERDNYEIY